MMHKERRWLGDENVRIIIYRIYLAVTAAVLCANRYRTQTKNAEKPSNISTV